MNNPAFHPLVERIANGVKIPFGKVDSVLNLSSQGGTVAFIARYRKEQTGGLDEVDIRLVLSERDRILEILDRQQTIIKAIEEQKKLTPELKARILSTFEKLVLEDIYAPYKKKKKTKADIARELGIEPFAESILKQRIEEGDYLRFARGYLDPLKNLVDPVVVVEHAVNIVTEIIAHDVDLKKKLRDFTFENGFIYSKKAPRFKEENSKFDTYFNYKEKIKNLINPKNSHRVLAIQRGFNEKALSIGIEADMPACLQIIHDTYIKNPKCIFYPLLLKAIEGAYKDYLSSSIELDIFNELKQHSDEAAISVFSKNVKDLLLQSPLGEKVILGMDPGFRTGCKLSVTGKGGEVLEYLTIYATEPHNKIEESEKILLALFAKHNVEAIAIGNGTASRETEKFAIDVLKKHSLEDKIICVVVNESGASVYSASETAREELPNLDITYRGAVSISRRLQDPLAELVKIDPKSIGVGQYQHDVEQKNLKESLEAVVEDCVNYVGVDLNTASPHLLAYVSGIGKTISKAIVEHRNANGLFKSRAELTKVQKLGDKIFEQCAGFLKIRSGENPLDNTGVHPERYQLIENVCKKAGTDVSKILGNKEEITKLFSDQEVVKEFGEYTIKDVIEELKKPGRDPRTTFKKIEFHEGLRSIQDLKLGLIVNGVVTNITNFGVFVNIGVHDDGLVHISELTDHGFINDPRQILSLGEEVKAKVIGLDVEKKQISLSIKQAKLQERKPDEKKFVPRENTRQNSNQSSTQGCNTQDNRNQQNRGQQNRPYNDRNQQARPQQARQEPRPIKVDPNSPFAVLAKIRDKVSKG
ncbi:MAG: Tex family protein [bacterium]